MRHYILAVFVILLLFSVSANEIYVSPSSQSAAQGGTFPVNVNVKTGTSDVYGVQFDLIYDSSLLSINTITEGIFLQTGSPTIFAYNLSNGKITFYEVRNSSTGINGDGTIVNVVFNSLSSGTSSLKVSDVIWVNSTIKNMSVGIPSVNLTNGSVVISSSGSGTTGSGGGGGGGSSAGVSIVINNSTGQIIPSTSGENESNSQNPVGDNSTSGENETNNTGLFSLTGRIIDDFKTGKVFSSWSFYFILFISICFVAVLLVRRRIFLKKRNQFENIKKRMFVDAIKKNLSK